MGDHQTAAQLWQGAVRDFHSRPAFRHRTANGWVDISFVEADRAAREVAAGLVQLGLAPGDRACFLAQTRLEWMLSDIAVTLAGGVSVPIYASLLAEQCLYIARDSGARVAIVEDAAQLEKLLPLAQGIAPMRLVHIKGDAKLDKPDERGRTEVKLAEVLASAGSAADRIFSFDDLRASGRAQLADPARLAELDARSAALTPTDPFTFIYTSGTTGNPKGVVIEHGCLLAALSSGVRALHINGDDLQFLFLPLAHVFAREVAWAPFLVGGVTAFAESITKVKDNLGEVRPTFMAGVPRIFEKFYSAVQAGVAANTGVKKALVNWAFGVGRANSQRLREGQPGGGLALRIADKLVLSKLRVKLGLDRCRFLISGGAPLAPEIASFFHAAGILILEGYGLTETMAAAFVNRMEKYRFGTVGPAIDVVETRIAEDGEILLRGPSIFKQYFNNQAATQESIDREGWFATGDIGVLEDGFLRITDRKKDLIVLAGGKKVAPQPIENALKAASPTIGQAMVHGDKKSFCVALVTLSEGAVARVHGDIARASADPTIKDEVDQAFAAVNRKLANFEQIKRWKILPADFTEQSGDLTPSLKIKRKVVLEKYRALLDALYAG